MTFFEECSNTFEQFIAVSCSIVLSAIIGLLTVTLSKKWLWGLIIVPFAYYFMMAFTEFLFFVLVIATLGIPLLFCM